MVAIKGKRTAQDFSQIQPNEHVPEVVVIKETTLKKSIETLVGTRYILYLERHSFLLEEPELSCNPGHDILELYNILVQVQFTRSKTKLDI